MKALGPRITPYKEPAALIGIDVAERWEEVFNEGLPKEKRDSLVRKYAPPRNCVFIDPPKLNQELKEVLNPVIVERDDKIIERQEKIAAAIGGISNILRDEIKKEQADLNLVETTGDVGRLLTDVQRDECGVRKRLFIYNLNLKETLKQTLQECKPDDFIFGKDLGEKLKSRKIIETSSKELLPKKGYNSKNVKNPHRGKKFRRFNSTNSSGYKEKSSNKQPYHSHQNSKHYKTDKRRDNRRR